MKSTGNGNAKSKEPDKKPTGQRRLIFIAVIILNLILLTSAFMSYSGYVSAYREGLDEENRGNIANLNHSAAMNATTLIDDWNTALENMTRYIQLHGMTLEQALDTINDFNSSQKRSFELISGDYTGFLGRKNEDGSYPPVSYVENSYSALQKAFDDTGDDDYADICFAPEFTNGVDRTKSFAIYKHLTILDENGLPQIHTLLLATDTKDIISSFNNSQSYENLSTVLIEADGDYIVSNTDFKSSNFYQYLYKYYGLSLDEKNSAAAEVAANGKGELNYIGSDGETYLYRYEKMETNNWYAVTRVPVSSFKDPALNSNYLILTVGMLALLFIVDVVWLQSTNRRLRISVQREAEASAAKGSFMSRMSHEIRTPLNAIIGYNTIASSEISEARDIADFRQAQMKTMDCLAKSDIASRHLLSIINDVLDMSAIESGRIKTSHERFDFRALITSLTTIFYSQAKVKNVRFEVVFDNLTEEWFVGDQMRVSQILTNLLSNAIKFTPEGGTVKLTISQPDTKADTSVIHFEITDNGIGMTPEFKERIFIPFEQADSSISRRFGGTGLGLAITKNLVDLMGGRIEVESESNVGTTFRVDLKFERTEQPENDTSYDFGGINALVVDDDRCTCDYVQQLFVRNGARCVTTTSGQEAIKLFENAVNDNNPFTVCLVDWHMPEIDGIETIKRLRTIAGKTLPLIVITAYDFTEVSDYAASAGVSTFISKPLFQSSLFDLLVNISGKKPVTKMPRNETYDFKGRRVLLAEDNAMNMEIASRILGSTGLQVDCAWNGQEAVSIFQTAPSGTFNAILMDVHMPVMDGHAATRTIRSSGHPEAKTIPIIAMTADAFAENVNDALAAGMNDHIAKPIDMPTLFAVLKKYM